MRRVKNYGECRHVGDFYWKAVLGRRSLSIALPAAGGNWCLATLSIGAEETDIRRPLWQWGR